MLCYATRTKCSYWLVHRHRDTAPQHSTVQLVLPQFTLKWAMNPPQFHPPFSTIPETSFRNYAHARSTLYFCYRSCKLSLPIGSRRCLPSGTSRTGHKSNTKVGQQMNFSMNFCQTRSPDLFNIRYAKPKHARVGSVPIPVWYQSADLYCP